MTKIAYSSRSSASLLAVERSFQMCVVVISQWCLLKEEELNEGEVEGGEDRKNQLQRRSLSKGEEDLGMIPLAGSRNLRKDAE